MKTTIEMAREAGARAQQEQNGDVEYLFSVDQIERLLAAECDRMCEQFNIPKELAHEKAKSNETD